MNPCRRPIAWLIATFLLIALAACGAGGGSGGPERQILYWANPMDPTIKSDHFQKDSMGMDYVPVYADEPAATAAPANQANDARKVLYWANPMDPTIKSDHFQKDSMGMDYVPVYADATDPGGESKGIRLSAYQEQLIGVQTEPVERRSQGRSVTATGRVSLNEQFSALVSARIAGRVEKLFVNSAGAAVRAGDSLLALYSPALVTAQQELLVAAKTPSLGATLAASAKLKLQLWGLSDFQIQNILDTGVAQVAIPVSAPVGGTILKVNVLVGQYVDEGAVLYEIADLDHLWVEAELFEQDLPSFGVGAAAEIIPLATQGRSIAATISFVAPMIDPSTRTAKIRLAVVGQGWLLKPGMLATVNLTAPGGQPRLVIPEAALIDTGRRQLVYVKTAPGRYSARSVAIQEKLGAWYAIASGLSEGELVVTKANFLIDSESQLKGQVE